MARKDLSRTVIEGGRTRGNKDRRRASHGIARARAREWLDAVRVDVDDADASAPRRPPRVYKRFADKLGPAMRWLDAQVGRPWSKVFGELGARFDTRTVAGRHIVHDHLLAAVALDGRAERRAGRQLDYLVDRRGLLRRSRGSGWHELRVAPIVAMTAAELRRLDRAGEPADVIASRLN